MGTVSYMAPELLMEQPVSEKIDVYSYAICLWYALFSSAPIIYPRFNFKKKKPKGNDHKEDAVPKHEASTDHVGRGQRKGLFSLFFSYFSLIKFLQSRLPIPDDCPKLFKNIMESSWKQDPKERPSFKTILGTLMSAIGTDFEIKGGAYMRPLTQQQSQWSASIDQTIEGVCLYSCFLEHKSLKMSLFVV